MRTPLKERLGHGERVETRGAIKRQTRRPSYIIDTNIPDRDTLDETNTMFSGLSRLKLAFRGLTEEEMATNAADARVIASHPSNDNLRGVARDAIRAGAVNEGKLADFLDLGGNKLKIDSIPSAAIAALSAAKVVDPPWDRTAAVNSKISSAKAELRTWANNRFALK